MIKKAVITDAGFASRYLPITKTIPKGMLPMHNKPIMQLVVEECVEAGIEEIVIVATPEGKPIYEDYFNNAVNRIRKQLASQGKSERYAPVQEVLNFPRIIVTTQDERVPYGNGSPLLSARDFIAGEDAFFYVFSDDIVLGKKGALKTMVEEYAKFPDVDGLVAAQKVSRSVVNKYGIAKFKDGEEEYLDELVEKPEPDKTPSLLATYGRYLLTQKVFEYLKPEKTGKDGELWIADAIDKLAKIGSVKVVKVDANWMTTGDPDNYIKAHLEYLKFIGK